MAGDASTLPQGDVRALEKKGMGWQHNRSEHEGNGWGECTGALTGCREHRISLSGRYIWKGDGIQTESSGRGLSGGTQEQCLIHRSFGVPTTLSFILSDTD